MHIKKQYFYLYLMPFMAWFHDDSLSLSVEAGVVE